MQVSGWHHLDVGSGCPGRGRHLEIHWEWWWLQLLGQSFQWTFSRYSAISAICLSAIFCKMLMGHDGSNVSGTFSDHLWLTWLTTSHLARASQAAPPRVISFLRLWWWWLLLYIIIIIIITVVVVITLHTISEPHLGSLYIHKYIILNESIQVSRVRCFPTQTYINWLYISHFCWLNDIKSPMFGG